MSMTSAADARSQAVSPAEMLFGIRYLPSQSVSDRDAPVSDGRALRGLRFGRGQRREAGGGGPLRISGARFGVESSHTTEYDGGAPDEGGAESADGRRPQNLI